MKTKEQILEDARIEMPFHLPERIKPYMEEAMEIFAKQQSIEFAKWTDREGWMFLKSKNVWYCELSETLNMIPDEELYTQFTEHQTLKETHENKK